jgi:adenosylcobinamide-GDP ribazoletransferase
MNSLLLALQFLTIIPVHHTYIASDRQLGNSILFYPVIGLLIGVILAFSSLMIANIPLQSQSVIILILWVFLTGGLHLDGLADCADAWVGGLGSKQRSLEIMKDPTAGPIAVVVLVLLLLLKWSLINYILEHQALAVLVMTPVMGRLAILMLMLSTNYIRTAGLGEKLVANLPVSATQVIALFGILLGIYYLGIIPISLMLIILLLIAYQANKRLGGVTGDVYGAAVELVEVSLLLGFVL